MTLFDQRRHIGRFLLFARELDLIEWLRPRLESVRPVDVARSVAGVERCLAGPYTYIGHAVAFEVPGGAGLDYIADLRAAGNHTVPALLLCLDPPESDQALLASALGVLLVRATTHAHASPLVDAVLERFSHSGLAYERKQLGVLADLVELSEGSLTPAELRVAELALTNWSRREIAQELGVSEKTVASHVTRVLAKCGGTGRRMPWLRERIARRARSRDKG